jgi:DNA polymerase-3 subunit epsilon
MTAESTTAKPPLRTKPVVFVDTETTGLDPKKNEILEIAIVALDGSVLLNTKVKPVNLETAHPKALEVNGYNDADWADAPTFAEIKDQVIEHLDHRVFVGQNPQFDRNFIVEALDRVGVEKAYRKVDYHTIDTITLAWEHLVPCGIERLNLDAICEFLGVPLDRENRHGALADAQAARTVYLMLLRATEEQRMAWRQRAKDQGLLPSDES